MSEWKAARESLAQAADCGDVARVRSELIYLIADAGGEVPPRVFALGQKLASKLADCDELVSLRLLILRSYTVEPMLAAVTTFALTRGIHLTIELGDFGQFEQVLLAGASSSSDGSDPDAVMLLSLVGDIEPRLAATFGSADIESAIDSTAERYSGWLDASQRAWPRATVLLGGPELPRWPAFGLADQSREWGHRRAVSELAERAKEVCREHRGAIYLDVDQVLAGVGYNNAFDDRMWAHAKQPYAPLALAAIAERCARVLSAKFLPRRKCVVLDCDNTLWGGVVGEDGIDGIDLGPEYPGSAFVAFQRELLALYDRGIILALASKNNEADVFEVLKNHRHQVLRPEHVAAHAIGWDDKVTGIESIAAQLNIGLDSLVFIDDSDYECALVSDGLPMVEVIQVPSTPLELIALPSSIESLDALVVSEDDRKRGAMYKAQATRARAQKSARSLDDFLHSLELELEIVPAKTTAEIERAAQLCQRTNQLNMTTKRHQVADIEAFASSDVAVVSIARLRDRFGDYGICGLSILEISGDVANIDTFLLSCRVIGRGVEDGLLANIEAVCKQHGIGQLNARFIPTAKNAPATAIYPRLGFEKVGGSEDEAVDYRKPIGEMTLAYPEWFKLTA